MASDRGTAKRVAVSAFSRTLYRTNEQRSEAHFYTLLGTLPCQSLPPAGTGMGFSSFSFLSNPQPSPGRVQHMAQENREWKNKMHIAGLFLFTFYF